MNRVLLALVYLCLTQTGAQSDNFSTTKLEQNEACPHNGATLNRSQLMDLSLECKYLILDTLDVPELISLTETARQFIPLIDDILRRRLATNQLILLGSNQTRSFGPIVTYPQGSVISVGYSDSLRVVKYFGHYITSIKIEQYFNPRDAAKPIYKALNQYCPETLLSIDMVNLIETIFDQFENPFTMVENVTLSGRFDVLGNSKMRLEQIFPALQRLTLKVIKVLDMNWVDRTFPKLQHFDAHIWSSSDPFSYFNQPEAVRLIESNHQIRSLVLRHVTPTMLKHIAIEVPHLESLELLEYDELVMTDNDLNCHFEHLKRISVKQSARSLPSHITFGNLEEFETDAFPFHCQIWINFVTTYKSLKKLRTTAPIKNAHVLRLSESHNSELEDIDLKLGKDVEASSVVKMIRNNKQLQKIRFFIDNDDTYNTIAGTLISYFDKEWIVDCARDQLSLHKKIL